MSKKKEYSPLEMIELIIKKFWIILLCMVVGAGGTFSLSKYVIPEKYTSSLLMYVAPNQGIEEGRTSINDLYYAQQVVNTYVEILRTNAFMMEVAKNTGLPYAAKEMSEMIRIQVVENTEVFQVKVVAKNPKDAQIIAESIAALAPAKIMSVVDVDAVKLVDPPVLPTRPTSPNLMINMVIGLILGAFLPIMLILFRDMLDLAIKKENDINKYNVPVLGIVPNEKFPVLDAYRMVRAKLELAMPKTGCKTIIVTSAVPGEGKTTVVCGLGKILGLGGQRVLIIDCAMRNASVHKIFNTKGSPGLSELLAGRVKTSEAIRDTSHPNLKLICGGTVPSNSAELLGSRAMKELLKTLEEGFDYILLDTPSTNLFADTLELAEISDGILLIARLGETTGPEFEKALSSLAFANATLLGVVLNDVESLSTSRKMNDMQ